MQFVLPLQTAVLIKRYKRFLADVATDDGKLLTLHCPNTGSMAACAEPGSRVWYWHSDNAKRKYPCTWELVQVAGQYLACINTQRANSLVVEAITSGTIKELQGYTELQQEVKYGKEGSRVDIVLRGAGPDCYVEVKNVTWWRGHGRGEFPDAVTDRGRKHLRELCAMVAAGQRAVLLFCAAHTGIQQVAPAWDKDPRYAETLLQAVAAGVEVYAYGADINTQGMILSRALPVALTRPVQ
ncbi:MAG: DNA/RNA nuclease SfsA [Gammaproteobacteria bacterium]|nr:DNA/RNA nuclease SfsA [Gammaproteobacteria bacterium]